MSDQKYLNDRINEDRAGTAKYTSGDVFEPVHADGHSDLGLHMGDMLAEPNPAFDPYLKNGAAQ